MVEINKMVNIRNEMFRNNLSLGQVPYLCKKKGVSFKDFMKYMETYIKTNATSEEVILYNSKKEEKSKEKRRLPFLNPILLELGIESWYLWEDEKERMLMGEYVFNYCGSKGKVKRCSELSKNIGISKTSLMELFDYYQIKTGKRYFNPNIYVPSNNVTKADEIFNKILTIIKIDDNGIYSFDEETKKTVKEIIKSCGYSAVDLKDRILGYITRHKLADKYYKTLKEVLDVIIKENQLYEIKDEDKLVQELISCYSSREFSLNDFCTLMNIPVEKFLSLVESTKKSNFKLYLKIKKIILAQETIICFLATNCNPIEFRSQMNISKDRMYDLTCSVKENNPYLYELYKNHLQETNEIIKIKLYELLEYLRNGIEVEGKSRNFSVIDYYLLVKMDFKLLGIYARLLDRDDDKNLITEFYRKYIRYIYNLPVTGNVMPDVEFAFRTDNDAERKLSIEEKQNIVSYLKEKCIPLNEFTIYEAYKLYVSGTLLGYNGVSLNRDKKEN